MMKPIALAASAMLVFSAAADAQAPAAAQQQQQQEQQQILAMIKDLQAQQVAIAENQAKIEAKVAGLAEALRVARIYSSRTGQGGGGNP